MLNNLKTLIFESNYNLFEIFLQLCLYLSKQQLFRVLHSLRLQTEIAPSGR